ncbi:MAG: PQQ-binding-like beta-propeller repeat protein, partial [Armatimonadetes bacterium]|nr:PQQ-binding-like beta-propeller repeat protein [Armatimonadota bacterium]
TQTLLSRFVRPTTGSRLARLVRSGILSAVCATLPLGILAGCGGGGSDSSSRPEASRATGSVRMSVKWPELSGTRLIPNTTKSIRLTITGARGTQTQLVQRPNAGGVSDVPFANLPIGSYTISAVAYSTTDETGTALATGNTTVTLTVDQPNQNVRFALGARLSTLEFSSETISINGTPPTIQLNTANITVANLVLSGEDADGAIIPLADTAITIDNPAIATLSRDPTSGIITITAVAPGETFVTATDPQTGVTIRLNVRVIQAVVNPIIVPVWTQILATAFRSGATLDTTPSTTNPADSLNESRLLFTANGRLLGFRTNGVNGTGFPSGGFPVGENYSQQLAGTTTQLSQPILGLTKNPRNDARLAFVLANGGTLYVADTRDATRNQALAVDGAFTEAVGQQEARLSSTVAVAVRPDTTRVDSYYMEVYIPTTDGALGRARLLSTPVAAPTIDTPIAYYQTPGGGLLTTPALDFGNDVEDPYTLRRYRPTRAVYVASSNLLGQSSRLHGFSTAETPTFPNGGQQLFQPVTLDGGVAAGVAVGRTYVFVATGLTVGGEAQVTAIEKTTGAIVWRRDLPGSTLVSGAPALSPDGESVYVGTWGGGAGSGDPGGQVFAMNANTGEIRWNFEAPYIDGFAFSDIDSSVTVGIDGRVYAGSLNSRVYALNPADGAQLFEGDLLGEIHITPVVSPDGTVYIGSDAGSFSALR